LPVPEPSVTDESPQIRALLAHSTLRRPSSVELGWSDFVIESRTILPSEKPEVSLTHHFVVLWDGLCAQGETAVRGGRFAPFRKYPKTITTLPPGIRPAARSRFPHDVIVGALDPDFMHRMEAELDARPYGAAHGLYGTEDPVLRNLLLLLARESEDRGRHGTLYADSLITALATRLLHAARGEELPARTRVSPLPPRSLRRVLERMEADLTANLDLATLAAETGYSRAHFLRTFRAATGQTPHRHLMELRLAKARDLMASSSLPLINIAAACGFSSHAHLTTAFRSRFGLTPSAYRRDLPSRRDRAPFRR
jgi:AraC family transcriptional regulator